MNKRVTIRLMTAIVVVMIVLAFFLILLSTETENEYYKTLEKAVVSYKEEAYFIMYEHESNEMDRILYWEKINLSPAFLYAVDFNFYEWGDESFNWKYHQSTNSAIFKDYEGHDWRMIYIHDNLPPWLGGNVE